jgi:hypothetical protein
MKKRNSKQKYKPLSSATPEEMQEAFLTTQRGSGAAEADAKLKRESNIENIKLVIGL